MNDRSVPNGYYNAKPTFCGLTKSKNGFDQFAIEFNIEVPESEPVTLTNFCGLSTDPLQNGSCSLEITMEQAEACGVDTSKSIAEWMIDPERVVRVKIENDDYGSKIRGVYKPGGNGALIRQQAMDDAQKKSVASALDQHIKALRMKQAANGGPRPMPKPAAKPKPATRPANGAPGNDFGDVGGPAPADDDIPF